MRRSRAPADAGFTLIEALVAFAVLAVLTLVLQRAAVGAVDVGGRARDRMDAALVARTLLASETLVRPGAASSGRLNGHRWRLRLEDVALPAAAAGTRGTQLFRPLRIRVEVELAGGGILAAERIRSVPFAGEGEP